MTNNPTIDGVSRATIERIADRLSKAQMFKESTELRSILNSQTIGVCRGCFTEQLVGRACVTCEKIEGERATAVERQEQALNIPEECPHLIVFDDADRENLMFSGTGAREAAMKTWEQISLSWNAHLFVRVERNSRDDRYPSATATALQSTIARLEARITQLESEAEYAAATYQAARDRIAELESGRGEPVAYVCTEWLTSVEHATHARREQTDTHSLALYASNKAAEKYDDVLLPFLALMRAELHANAHKGDRPGWLQMDRKTAVLEVFYHMGKLHQAAHRNEAAAIKEYAADVANMCMMLLDVCACLDATAALNNKPSTEVKS